VTSNSGAGSSISINKVQQVMTAFVKGVFTKSRIKWWWQQQQTTTAAFSAVRGDSESNSIAIKK